MSKEIDQLDVKVDCEELKEFYAKVEKALGELMGELSEKPYPAGSRALQFAVEAGLRKKAFYSVKDTARYLGVSREVLDAEHAAGRIRYMLPRCNERGAYIHVDEVDRWIEANSE